MTRTRSLVAAGCAGGIVLAALAGALPASAEPLGSPTTTQCPAGFELLSLARLVDLDPQYAPASGLDVNDDGLVCGNPFVPRAGEAVCPPVLEFCQVPVVYLFRDNDLAGGR